ncbi:YbbC/YhhH family protein [Flavobacterium sp. GP15]|uniref:YbbC/YhhH family protein n=1 Tax=Flavobacterium sp. GP15 TaxID=2758567 RepID=UPI00165EA6D9|nr:YbbC/YhhH family protein [Flavobacterium sp. GP15]
MKKIILMFFVIMQISCNQVLHNKLGIENAKKELENALNDTTKLAILDKNELLIKEENTAIKVAEPILFEIYGKSKIEDEKPYEAYLINNYWVINGTINRFSFGGAFSIIIDARNSKVVNVIHYK